MFELKRFVVVDEDGRTINVDAAFVFINGEFVEFYKGELKSDPFLILHRPKSVQDNNKALK